MNLLIPKIIPTDLSVSDAVFFEALDSKIYGLELATAVTEKLTDVRDIHKGLYFSHRDYCGLGLFYKDQQFILATVYDGFGPNDIIAQWITATEFISWLAHEHDQSMSLYGTKHNNQTITKIRLEWYLENDYNPVWNSFCEYMDNQESPR